MINPFSAVNLSGIAISLIVGQMVAGTVFLHHPFDREVFLRQVAEERIAFAVAAPAVLTMLLKDEALVERHRLDSLRCVMSGSAGMSGWMIGEYRRRFGIDIVNGFGSNEGVTLVSTAADIPDPTLRAEYFPRPASPGAQGARLCQRAMEARLVQPESGADIEEPGVIGELAIRGGGIFPGYFRRPDLTAAAFDRDGFFHTGDLFQIASDENGRPNLYRYVGRLGSVINRGGMKISPEELAALMEQHPSVAEADAAGYPDPVLGERVCACVALRPDATLTLEELIDFLTAKGIARHKLPERLQLFERLPRNVTGKVERPAMLRLMLGAVDGGIVRVAPSA
jgi:acyl-CoA synthetase (AMP-forming)/AMP-acid ligase II